MPQEHAGTDGADNRADAAAVVEWGDTDSRPIGGAGRGGRAARGLSRLLAEHRRAPLAATIAGFALFGSLLSDWRMSTIENELGAQRIATGIASFPAVGSAYLVGLFALTACGALALFGTGTVRRHARLVGLAVAAVLGALLITTVAHLDQLGGTIDDYVNEGPNEPATMGYGRGVYLAFAGIAAAALALYLAPSRRAGADDGATGDVAPAPGDQESTAAWAAEHGDDWPWRSRETRQPSAGPADLTVEPAAPFLPPADD